MNKKSPEGKSQAAGAVIYCRVSSQEQVENFSLATQEKECRAYCSRNGLEVVEIFIEEGESAKTVNRPEFQKMLQFCQIEKGRIASIIVYNVSRFARNMFDFEATKAFLIKLGVTLRSVTELLNETPQGKLMGGMMALFAQFDNDLRSDRTQAGMKAAASAGRWPFKAPLGYLNGLPKKGGPSLLPDPERAHLVLKAFELVAAGHTAQETLQHVASCGLKTVRNKKVSPQTFVCILRNPIYTGRIVIRQWEEGGRGDFEPIVSQELFDLVQAVLAGKRPGGPTHMRSHPDFPLRHFVICGCCGIPLTASYSRGRTARYPYYHCRSRDCLNRAGKADFEAAFLRLLAELQPKQKYMKLFREIVLDAWRDRQAENVAITCTLERKLESLEERRQRLIDAFVYEKAIDRETYDDQRHKLEHEILIARSAANDAKLDEFEIEGVLEFAEHILTNTARLWMEASHGQRQQLQSCFFLKGLLLPTEHLEPLQPL